MTTTTTRLGILEVQGTDSIVNYPTHMASAMGTIDGVYLTETPDWLTAGVVGNAGSTNPNASGPTINSGTGVISVTLTADVGYATVSTILTRFPLPTGTTNLTPSLLPTSGNYVCVGVFAAPSGTSWNTTGSLSQACGTSQTTAALALSNPPSTPAGTIPIEYVVIHNTAGVYSISSTTDERPLARGTAFPPYTYITAGSNYSAKNGDWVSASAGITVTAPAPVANARFAVHAANGTVTINPYGTDQFFGAGLYGATSVTVTGLTNVSLGFVAFQSNGGSWVIVGGQADSGWQSSSVTITILP